MKRRSCDKCGHWYVCKIIEGFSGFSMHWPNWEDEKAEGYLEGIWYNIANLCKYFEARK